MSAIRRQAARAREETRRAAVRFRGLIRRMAISATEGGLWQLLGPKDEAGAAEVAADVEVFQGIGYASRPQDGKGEVVVVKIGGALTHPVVIATRDESIRVDLDEDETAVFNGSSIVKVKADGTIEIGSQGGTFAPLALKSDVTAISYLLKNWTVVATDGGLALQTAAKIDLASIPAGTTKLKAE